MTTHLTANNKKSMSTSTNSNSLHETTVYVNEAGELVSTITKLTLSGKVPKCKHPLNSGESKEPLLPQEETSLKERTFWGFVRSYILVLW